MILQSELVNYLNMPLDINGGPEVFCKFIEDISLYSENIIRNKIKEFLENMDLEFRNKKDRGKEYYVSNTRYRTIITMYGEITYLRTIYKRKIDNSYFCYVDQRLGIDKYHRYTNDIASYVYEAYSDENSMIKIGNEIANLIYAKYSLKDNRNFSLSRQTVYNSLQRAKRIKTKPEYKKDIEDVYILLDEKYLNSKNNKKKKMIKSCGNNLQFIDKITTQNLCKFHFHQALWRLCKDKDIYNIAVDYLYHNSKEDLKELLKSLSNESNEKEVRYINRNYESIQNTIHLKDMNCAMEQCISHHLNSHFDNVPKAYGDNNKLSFLLSLNRKNDDNLYINNLDYSIFDNNYPIPYYSTELITGKRPIKF